MKVQLGQEFTAAEVQRGYWRIGNGNNVSIWYDRWFPPHVDHLLWGPPVESLVNAKVVELINQDEPSWKADLVESSFLPIDAAHILRFPLPSTSQEDKFCWTGVKCGIYSVRSGYYVALQTINDEAHDVHIRPSPPNFNWKKLWELPCQPKHLHFMWRLLQGTLPVRNNLIKRGIQCDTRCPWCGINDETKDHLFRDCTWAVEAWAQSPLKLVVRSLPGGPLSLWINDLLSNGPEDRTCLFIAVCYGLWFARNKKIFEDKEIPLQNIFSKACESILNNATGVRCQLPVGNSSPEQCHNWEAPPQGWYKLNRDAAMVDAGNWGIGIVARDHEGFVIAATSRKIETLADVTFAEAMGLRMEMMFALDLSLEDAIFETDCKVVVDQIVQNSYHSSYAGLVTHAYSNLAFNFRNCQFSYTRRTNNIAAHLLAKFACFNPEISWIEETPNCISSIVAADICPGLS
ncbi:Ribonuclease H-like superfamily [Sesbania bispinosa]|nr:Ribonuclease H-like superfamily [Sesbania bispinosa]